MKIFKRGPSWTYRFDTAKIGGKRRYEQKGGFKNRKEAELASAKAFEEYSRAGTVFKPSEMSVKDFFELWMKEYCQINLKKTTIRRYKEDLKHHIFPTIGKYKICHITPSIIQKLINDMFNAGYARETISGVKGVLSGGLNYAVEPLRLIPFSPVKSTRLPSPRAVPKVLPKKRVRMPVSDERLAVIWERFPEGHVAHIPLKLGIHAGLRRGEVFGLQWSDVNLDEGYIAINNQAQYCDENKCWEIVPPKYDSIRTVYIDSGLLELLRRTKLKQEINRAEYREFYTRYYLGERNEITKSPNETEVFFVNVREDGSYINYTVLTYTTYTIKHHLGFKEFDFHSTRHTHSTDLYVAGASFLDIKERLGHCDLSTTLKYTHNDDRLRERTKKLVEKIYGDGESESEPEIAMSPTEQNGGQSGDIEGQGGNIIYPNWGNKRYYS